MNINTLDLNALRVFERVAATGSFTAAARHFHRAVSSVSRQIGSLEESSDNLCCTATPALWH